MSFAVHAPWSEYSEQSVDPTQPLPDGWGLVRVVRRSNRSQYGQMPTTIAVHLETYLAAHPDAEVVS